MGRNSNLKCAAATPPGSNNEQQGCRFGAPFPHDTLCGGGSSVVATPAPGSANVRGTSAVHTCIAPHAAGAAGGAGAQHYAYRPG